MELKPCPVCGGNPKLYKRRSKVYYECNGDCWTCTKDFSTELEARKAWNQLADKYAQEDTRHPELLEVDNATD